MDEAERLPGESAIDWVLRVQQKARLPLELKQLRTRIAELEAENAALRAMIDGALTDAEAMVATLAGAR